MRRFPRGLAQRGRSAKRVLGQVVEGERPCLGRPSVWALIGAACTGAQLCFPSSAAYRAERCGSQSAGSGDATRCDAESALPRLLQSLPRLYVVFVGPCDGSGSANAPAEGVASLLDRRARRRLGRVCTLPQTHAPAFRGHRAWLFTRHVGSSRLARCPACAPPVWTHVSRSEMPRLREIPRKA